MRIWNMRELVTVLAVTTLTSFLALPSLAAGPYKVQDLGALRWKQRWDSA